MIEVSVVIPTFNRVAMVCRAVQSVLRQTYTAFEVIVVDDGSSDGTEVLIQELMAQDRRVRYIRHSANLGAQASRNIGSRAAIGKYLAFLDSDNEWLPEKLELQMEVFQRKPQVGVVYCGMRCISEDGAIQYVHPRFRGRIYSEVLENWVADTSTLVIKRHLLQAVGLWDEAIRAYHEWDICIRLAACTDFDFVPQAMVLYHRHTGSRISTNLKKNTLGHLDVVLRHQSAIMTICGAGVLSRHYMKIGRQFVEAGELELANDNFNRAVQLAQEVMQTNPVSALGNNEVKGSYIILDIAACYRHMNRWDWALYYYCRMLEVASATNDISAAAECTYCIGLAHQQLRQYDRAQQFLELSLTLHEQLNNDTRVADILTKLENGDVEQRGKENTVPVLPIASSSRAIRLNRDQKYTVLLAGVGQQGRAALFHLSQSPNIVRVLAGDIRREQAEAHIQRYGGDKAEPVAFEVHDREASLKLLKSGIDIVIDILPKALRGRMAQLAVEAGVHLVNTFDDYGEVSRLHARALSKGITLLPGLNRSPAIESLLCLEAINELDEVHELYAYTGGFPAPEAADNPLRYKISWSPKDLLRAYMFPARQLIDGRVVDIPGEQIFAPEHVHEIHVEGLGQLEAFPHTDALPYKDALHLSSNLRYLGRYVLRYPGHAAIWKTLVDLHFLDDRPVTVAGTSVIPREFLQALLVPQLQYREFDRDVTCIRAEARGLKAGKRTRAVCELIDYKDLQVGLLSMSRVVGFAASIAAQMILRGDIQARGVLSPVWAINREIFFKELERAGITAIRKWSMEE